MPRQVLTVVLSMILGAFSGFGMFLWLHHDARTRAIEAERIAAESAEREGAAQQQARHADQRAAAAQQRIDTLAGQLDTTKAELEAQLSRVAELEARPVAPEIEEQPARAAPRDPAPEEEDPGVYVIQQTDALRDVSVIPLLTMIGPVIVVDEFGGGAITTEERYFRVVLRVSNRSDSKKLNYRTWAGDGLLNYNAGILKDEHDNIYRRIEFGFSKKVLGATEEASVYPGESIRDTLVFERPVQAATILYLTLPGDNVGAEQPFTLEFTVAHIAVSP